MILKAKKTIQICLNTYYLLKENMPEELRLTMYDSDFWCYKTVYVNLINLAS